MGVTVGHDWENSIATGLTDHPEKCFQVEEKDATLGFDKHPRTFVLFFCSSGLVFTAADFSSLTQLEESIHSATSGNINLVLLPPFVISLCRTRRWQFYPMPI